MRVIAAGKHSTAIFRWICKYSLDTVPLVKNIVVMLLGGMWNRGDCLEDTFQNEIQ